MLLDGLADSFRTKLLRHADFTSRLVVVAFQVYRPKLAVPYATSRLVVANRQAGALAVQYVTTTRAALILPPQALEVTARDDRKRLAQALTTASQQGPGSLERLGRSEPLQAAQQALSEAVEATGLSWVRHTGPNPCPICQRLADGKPRSPKVPMARGHPNCSCVQKFVEEAPWQPSRRKPRRSPRKAAGRKATRGA